MSQPIVIDGINTQEDMTCDICGLVFEVIHSQVDDKGNILVKVCPEHDKEVLETKHNSKTKDLKTWIAKQ